MVVVDLEKCAGCGICQMVCPREAARLYGYSTIDPERCTDCYDGIHQFEKNDPVKDKAVILDPTLTLWVRACVENCPVEAISVKIE